MNQWQQDIVNAQTEVNRCNYQANKEKPDLEYVVRHAQHAINDLLKACDRLLQMRGQKRPWHKR